MTRPICLLLAAMAVLAAPAAQAKTLALAFEPPQIEVEKICVSGQPDEQIAANWAKWDGVALPDRDPAAIQRDLRRLMDIDAIRWFDTLQKAYALLPAVDPKFDAEKAMLTRTELLIAAGRLKELTNLQLVPKLLQTDVAASPRLQNILSDYLMQGTGIAADKDRAMTMLVAAGYGGNADALLKIVALQQKGSVVPGWDVPPDIAVTLAFGALVGKLDPMICDRVARIGREYINGGIVTRDVPMAEKWFRFAADMGDNASAWKVAEMHMQSEDLVKSNDVLIKYLTKAADGGLPYAQVALGRLYEQGALVGAKDIEKARTLYAAAASFGDRAGLLRNALFLQSQAKADATNQPAYHQALLDFAQRDDAPAWIFVALGDQVMAAKGRWAGEAEAVAFYERAEKLGEFDGAKRLTPIRFRYTTTPAEFYAVVDDVIGSVHQGGEIDPMNGLKNAFACRAPQAPQRDEALYWEGINAATGTKTSQFTPQELLDLIANPNPQDMARLQTQALYGRPAAVAQYLAVLERAGVPATELAFWQDYATRFDGIEVARGRLERGFAEIGQNLTDPVVYLRAAVAKGDVSAGVDLADLLMRADPVANAAEALALLEPVAAAGKGAAMRLLPAVNPARFPDLAAVYATYRDVIEARGDFDAIVLALPFQTNPAVAADYARRASTETDCSFDQVADIADAMGQRNDPESFAKWMEVAEFLSQGDGWRMVQLGDLLRRHGGDPMLTAQLDYYQRGYDGGNITAIHRLLDITARTGTALYDPARSADLFVDLVRQSDADDIPNALSRLSKAEPAIQTNAYARLDVPALYLAAAQSGNAAGMREYGKLLLVSAQSATDLETAAGWIAKAADQGDVKAMMAYADALAFGMGVPASQEQALTWLNKAAEAGNEDAVVKVRSLSLQQPKVTQ